MTGGSWQLPQQLKLAYSMSLSGKNLPVRPDEFRPNHPDAILDPIVSFVHEVPARVLMRWRLSSTFAGVKKPIDDFK